MYRLIPVVISCLMLAAHFLRVGVTGLVFMWISAPLLLFVKKKWVPNIFYVMLSIGAAIWINTTRVIWKLRISIGMPKTRMAIILGCVALFTLVSSLVFKSKSLKKRYCSSDESGAASTVAFILTVLTMLIVQMKMRPAGLLLDRFIYKGGSLEGFWLGVYAAHLVGVLSDPERSRKWRPRLWAFFSFIFFTQFIIGLAWVKKFLMTGELHLPVPALIVAGPVFRGGGYFMLILFAVTVIIVGPAWCSWLCYIGSWDDIASRRQTSPKELPKFRKYLRIIILVLVITAAFMMRLFGVSTTHAAYAALTFGIIGVIIMLFWSTRTGAMTHCTAYCPIGFIACRLGELNPFRVLIKEDCNGCGKCTEVCRYDALTKDDISRKAPGGSCTLCGDCIASCEKRKIYYRFPFITDEKARVSFIVLIVSLHAVFLGVARI